MALGSALESGACLDVMVAMQVASIPEIQPGKALLVEIVAMLTKLAKSVAGERVREPESIYHPPSP